MLQIIVEFPTKRDRSNNARTSDFEVRSWKISPYLAALITLFTLGFFSLRPLQTRVLSCSIACDLVTQYIERVRGLISLKLYNHFRR